ncbi:hypothetical protein RFI_15066, partial [Reticulomyxa filosa]
MGDDETESHEDKEAKSKDNMSLNVVSSVIETGGGMNQGLQNRNPSCGNFGHLMSLPGASPFTPGGLTPQLPLFGGTDNSGGIGFVLPPNLLSYVPQNNNTSAWLTCTSGGDNTFGGPFRKKRKLDNGMVVGNEDSNNFVDSHNNAGGNAFGNVIVSGLSGQPLVNIIPVDFNRDFSVTQSPLLTPPL